MTGTTVPRGDALDALLGAIEGEMHARRLSPADVARRAGVPVATVRHLRRGRPTVAAALALAWALDITPSGTSST
ncbi:MAG: helix-turn-helix transcriptional regulator [Candidatus Limnocylindrales bacterium]